MNSSLNVIFAESKDFKICLELAKKVKALGGETYCVGGCVRDAIQQKPCKDFDIEVYGECR